MEIQVRLFAILAEKAGTRQTQLSLPDEANISQALAALEKQMPAVKGIIAQCRVAINQEFQGTAFVLKDGDELAIIPPVSGGSGPRANVLDEPLSVDRVLGSIQKPEFGGVAIFIGVVRNHNDGRNVRSLSYESYQEMAEKIFQSIIETAQKEHEPCLCAIEHRTGDLAIGDWAVITAAAAPHRQQAFAACRYLIEELKKNAPIWKKETDDRGIHWLGTGP